MPDESIGVKRRDTTKGPPLRVLCLDGGGVRGYSTMIIVQELMHRTFVEIEGRAPRRHEIPKPCDHFDLIVGTGTGGLIALMLGRLRLDLETCKELYVQMTRRVFQTDKTIAGIPYRSTLFKASKLEEAIKEAVRAHTGGDKEGGRSDSPSAELVNPLAAGRQSSSGGPRRNLSNASTVSFSARSPAAQMARPIYNSGGGDPNARLYDARNNRTKTAVTAMYKGSPKGSPATLLRSYDSRHEPPPEFDCTIWQAGRATSAVGLAFKPIQIGQSVFHDDGAGTFNPAPEALDEAVVNEWPGREVGVFVSVGTGKRPKSSDPNSHMWYEGFLGEFAEARKRLIAKIENCETIHEFMKRDYLAQRGVLPDNYYRLNVEIGVGEFGMNEWHRLGDISTGTRRYMARHDEQKMVRGISTKLAKIYKAKQRIERGMQGVPEIVKTSSTTTMENPFAVELPGDAPPSPVSSSHTPPPRASFDSGLDHLQISPKTHSARFPQYSHSQEHLHPSMHNAGSHASTTVSSPSEEHGDRLMVNAPTPEQYKTAAGTDKIAIVSPDEHPRSPAAHQQIGPMPTRIEPPPLPPKTPLQDHQRGRGPDSIARNSTPPYPDEEPPPVNMSRKPDMRGR